MVILTVHLIALILFIFMYTFLIVVRVSEILRKNRMKKIGLVEVDLRLRLEYAALTADDDMGPVSFIYDDKEYTLDIKKNKYRGEMKCTQQ